MFCKVEQVIQVVTNAREWKKFWKNVSFWKKKLKLNFWIFDPFFRKFDQITLMSEKNQIFEKVIFDVKSGVLGRKLLLVDIFWAKN